MIQIATIPQTIPPPPYIPEEQPEYDYSQDDNTGYDQPEYDYSTGYDYNYNYEEEYEQPEEDEEAYEDEEDLEEVDLPTLGAYLFLPAYEEIIAASYIMPIPFSAIQVNVFDWADMETALAGATAGDIFDFVLMNDITATSDAIRILQGVTVYLRSNRFGNDTFSIYQHRVTPWGDPRDRHFIVRYPGAALHLGNVHLTRDLSVVDVNMLTGGIDVRYGARVYMYDGSIISNNNAAFNGGGIRVEYPDSHFTMYGGRIENNHAATNHGGGFSMRNGATALMTGGLIYNNTAEESGGGVDVRHNTFTMTGGTIRGNNALTSQGGGVVVAGGGIFNMSGTAVIEGNNSQTSGAGIRIQSSDPGIPSGTMTLSGNARITNNTPRTGSGGGISVSGTLTMTGGTIYGNSAPSNGGGVQASTALFEMTGGTIHTNTASDGGGVWVGNVSSFTMDGADAVIRNNTATNNGGGMFVAGAGSTADIYSGLIHTNTANNGGGVQVSSAAAFTMKGADAIVRNNTAAAAGGGVVTTANSSFDMTGGTIHTNTATNGGGVWVGGGASFTMDGADAVIHTNTATSNGGGVHVTGANSTFDMTGSEIHTNTAVNGGGVYVNDGSTFTMDGADAVIRNNTAELTGGGVQVRNANSEFTMSDGTIAYNRSETTTSGAGGGGISGSFGSTVTISGGAIRNNYTTSAGGGVNMSQTSQLIMTGGRIHNNIAQRVGGGIQANNETHSIISDSAIIEYNIAEEVAGGGIRLQNDAVLELSGNAIIRNNVAPDGGGLSIQARTRLYMSDNTEISGNTATANGGGINANTNAQLIATGGSITGNTAGLDGGGIWTANHEYASPLLGLPNSYSNLSIAPAVVFNGNSAGNGSFAPPSNWPLVTWIQGNGTSPTATSHSAHQLNNYDVNFRTGPMLAKGTNTVGSVNVGDTIEYVITVANPSALPLTNPLIVRDELNLTMVAFQAGTLTVTRGGAPVAAADYATNFTPAGVLYVTLHNVPANSITEITFEVEVLEAAAGAVVTNTASFVGLPGETPPVEVPVNPLITKEADRATAMVDDIIEYTIAVTNNGEEALEGNFVVTDVINANFVTAALPGSLTVTRNGVTLVTNVDYSVDLTADIGEVTLGVILHGLPAESITEITFNATVLPAAQGQTIVNYATLLSPPRTPEDTPTTQRTPDVLIPIGRPITKTATQDSARIGDTIDYTITVVNTSANPVATAQVVDVLSSYVSFVAGSQNVDRAVYTFNHAAGTITVNLPNMLPGEVVEITFQVIVEEIPADGIIRNSATFSRTGYPNEEDEEEVLLGFSKNAEEDAVRVGNTITYTIALMNTSEDETVAWAEVVDQLSSYVSFVADSYTVTRSAGTVYTFGHTAGFITVDIPNLQPLEVVTITFQVLVDEAPANGVIENTARLYKDGVFYDDDSEEVDVDDDLIEKTADQSSVRVGGVIDYTITVRNTSNYLVGFAQMRDTLSSDVALVPGSVEITRSIGTNSSYTFTGGVLTVSIPLLQPGEEVTIEFQVTVLSAPADGIIRNNARLYNNGVFVGEDEEDVPLDPISKNAEEDSVTIGDNINYVITVANTSDYTVDLAEVVDTLSSHVQFVAGSVVINRGSAGTSSYTFTGGTLTVALPNLLANEVVTIEFQVTVLSAPADGIIRNSATLYKDGEPYDECEEEVPLNPISKNAEEDSVSIGGTINYVITVANMSEYEVALAEVVDELSSYVQFVPGSVNVNRAASSYTFTGGTLTVALPNLQPEEVVTITFQVTVLSAPENGIIENTATLYKDGELYDYDEEEVPLNPISKNAEEDSVTIGGTINYVITVANTSDYTVDLAEVVDTLSSHVQFVAGSVVINRGSAGTSSYTFAGSTLTVALPDLQPNEVVTIEFQVTVLSAPADGIIRNSATLYKDGEPYDECEEEVPLNPISKNAEEDSVSIGGTINYVITVANMSDYEVALAEVVDQLSSYVQFVPGSVNVSRATSSYTFTGGTLTVALPNLQPEEVVTITFQVIVLSAPENGIIENTATLYKDGEPYDYDEEEVPLNPISKNAEEDSVKVGGTINYVITVANTSNYTVDLAEVVDTLSSHVQFVPGSVVINRGSAGTSSYTFAGRTLTVALPNLLANEVVTIEFQVTVLSAPADGIIRNSATLYKDGEPYDECEEEVPLNPISKNAEEDSVSIGGTINYVITVANMSDYEVALAEVVDQLSSYVQFVPGSVTVDRASYGYTFTGGTLTVALPNLQPEEIVTITFQVTVLSAPENGIIENTATLYKDGEPYDYDEEEVPLTPISKNAEEDSVKVGGTINYVITVANTSNYTVDLAEVVDTLSSHVQFVAGSVVINRGSAGTSSYTFAGSTLTVALPNLLANEVVTIEFQVTVLSAPADGIIRNSATLYKDGEPYDECYEDIPLDPISKNAEQDSVTIGGTIDYVITVANMSDYAVALAEVVDTLSSHVAFVPGSVNVSRASSSYTFAGSTLTVALPNLQPNEVVTITFQVTVLSAPANGIIRNVARLYKDGQPYDECYEDIPLDPISKNAEQDAVAVGGTIDYVITVANTSNYVVALAEVVDTLSSHVAFVPGSVTITRASGTSSYTFVGSTLTVALPNLQPNEVVTITFQVTVLSSPADGIIRNSATLYKDGEPYSTCEEEVPVNATIAKTSGVSTANVGDAVGYTITVGNNFAEAMAGDFVVTDVLDTRFVQLIPDTLTVTRGGVAVPAAQFTADLSVAGTVRVTLHGLPASSTTEISFQVRVLPAAAGNTIRNAAVLQGPPCTETGEYPPPTTTPYVEIPVPPPAGNYALTINKAADVPHGGHVRVGQVVTYTISASNIGSVSTGSILIQDIIPYGMTLVAGSAVTRINGVINNTIAPTFTNGVLVWTFPYIAAGATVTVSFQVTVNALPAGVYNRVFSNTATVGERSTNTVELTTQGLVKHPDRMAVNVGENINWTLRGFHNPVDDYVADFAIVDRPGLGLNFRTGSLPAFTNGEGITYEIRYRVAGSSAWHTHATGVDASQPFTFSLPQPGNLHYTDIGFFFGDVPADFALGNQIVLTFVVGNNAPNNILVNRFFILFDNIEREGYSPYRPGVNVPPQLPPQQPGIFIPPPPGTGMPYTPWGRAADPAYIRYDDPPYFTPIDPAPIDPIHHAFMIGFREDGTIRPQANITRAEVTTIFFRLITDQHRANIWSQTNSFGDVPAERWFNNPISTMERGGLFAGLPLGSNFSPNQAATRAEFAAMVVNHLGLGHYRVTGGNAFTDIGGHWASDAINVAYLQGWVRGFGDGTFRPDQLITRAEVAALVNRALGRLPETADDLLPGMIMWPDNMNPNTWYFLYIQEATNSHHHQPKEDGIHETWTHLIDPRNWRALERPYSMPWDILGQ